MDYVINASSDLESSLKSIKLAENFGFIYAAIGVHPHETHNMDMNKLNQIEKMYSNNKCVAIGEIGLDYYYENTDRETQKFWLDKQLNLAEKLSAPVVIHDRDAHKDCLDIIKKHNVKGVFHCFSGSADMAAELVKKGWYVSFNGVITFKNAKKAVEAVKKVPIEKILIETDCPYLSPEPLRGRRNEPGHIKYVAMKIAEIKDMTLEQTAYITSENAKKLFNLS